jgi:methionyl-tRNA formyltransferase
VPALRALVGAGHDVALVVTRPDRRRGRGPQLSPSPVKAAAVELGLPVSAKVDDVLTVGAELGVVVAFGRLVKPHVLAELDMVNVHFSLLPRWRGAAPVERAILAGDAETGVCLMALEEGLDTGDVYSCERVVIGPEETAEELRRRLTDVGTELLVTALERGRESLPTPRPQAGEPTYAAKLDPAELHLDWSRPAVELHRLVRLGRAWTTVRGRRLEVVRARVAPRPPSPGSPGQLEGLGVATGDGALELVAVKPEGRGVVPADSWLRGARLAEGEVLGT